MTDLAAFGGGAEPADPPQLERQRLIQSPRTGKLDGCVCLDRTTGDRVYAARRFPGHYYPSGGGYGISDAVLRAVDAIEVNRLLVHEDDDAADVFEFWMRMYTDEGANVPPGQLHDPRDPERYFPTDHAVRTYPEHAGKMYSLGFLDAAQSIGWRGFDADHPAREDADG